MATDHRITIEHESGSRLEWLVTPELARVIRAGLQLGDDDSVLKYAADPEATYSIQSFDPRPGTFRVITQHTGLSLGDATALLPQFIADTALELAREVADDSGSWIVKPESWDTITFQHAGEITRRITIEQF